MSTCCAASWYLWHERGRCWYLLLVFFFTLGGVGLSGGIICTIFSDWFGGCGVTLSRYGVVVIGGMFTLGNFGATIGGMPGDCVSVSDGICATAGVRPTS